MPLTIQQCEIQQCFRPATNNIFIYRKRWLRHPTSRPTCRTRQPHTYTEAERLAYALRQLKETPLCYMK